MYETQVEMTAFDMLPKELRDFLNSLTVKFEAVRALRIWQTVEHNNTVTIDVINELLGAQTVPA